jgi:hypothetical protein
LFRNRGKGKSPAEQALEAAERAVKAYEVLVGKCPYKIVSLAPSKSARSAFG